MDQMIFTREKPEHWDALCASNADLFNASEWHSVLSVGFGNKTLYGWDKKLSNGMTITIFMAGPFRVGYLGFPVGGSIGGLTLSPDIVNVLRDSLFPVKLHCIRMPVSAFDTNTEFNLTVQTTPETAIENLEEWHYEGDTKLRQSVNKAMRSPLEVADASDPSQGEALFDLYRDTVSRHGGGLRYTAAYFCALINLAKSHSQLRCLLAVLDDQLVGFEVVACHGQTAYSLHGCTSPDFRKYSTSDLLTYSAIAWAKEQGLRRYNLMASPRGRTSLIRYKEKWGGVTRQQKTYELALKPIPTAMFNKASSLYHKMPGFMKMTWGR
jgi:hypothetical protein